MAVRATGSCVMSDNVDKVVARYFECMEALTKLDRKFLKVVELPILLIIKTQPNSTPTYFAARNDISSIADVAIISILIPNFCLNLG